MLGHVAEILGRMTRKVAHCVGLGRQLRSRILGEVRMVAEIAGRTGMRRKLDVANGLDLRRRTTAGVLRVVRMRRDVAAHLRMRRDVANGLRFRPRTSCTSSQTNSILQLCFFLNF